MVGTADDIIVTCQQFNTLTKDEKMKGRPRRVENLRGGGMWTPMTPQQSARRSDLRHDHPGEAEKAAFTPNTLF